MARHAGRLRELPDRIGRYQIRDVLGAGGFAVVVRAYDEALDADTAIKILDLAHAEDADIRDRFVREAQLLRRVHSPHVVAVHDIGDLADGRPFLVMEFAAGGSLADRLPAGAAGVDPDGLGAVIGALADGLGALHDAGVVHRDVKPANLLVVTRGDARGAGGSKTAARRSLLELDERLVVGDLGLAKDQDRTSSEPTILGGTPHYRAPEQTELGASITPATDVYAATGVIWRLVTGELPPPPGEVGARLLGVPGPWHELFEGGLASEPDARFETIADWETVARRAVGAAPVRASIGFRSAQPGTTCPYKGLAAFQPEDAALFFGREALVERLVSRLQSARTLVIGGPSGSGKSSLLRAGVIPAIEAGALAGSQSWTVVLVTPGGDALGELHQALVDLAPEAVPVPSVEELRGGPRSARAIGTESAGALLAIDQFEELFTLNPEADVTAFLAVLAELVAPTASRVRLVLALRADFYAECAGHEWLARCISDNQVLVGPMQRAELRSAIEGPAHRVGLRLEDGLADAVLEDGTPAGSLPLIAHALMETWLRRRGSLLTLDGFRAAGGVAGGITQSADALYERLGGDERTAARRLLLRLVNPGEGTADTRRRVTWRELGNDPTTRRVVDALADARLLTVDDDSVEIAHEAIIQSWPLLRGWIEEARDDLRVRQRIDRAAAEWDGQSHNPALLSRGTPLEAALTWSRDHPGELGPIETEFLDASLDARRTAELAAADERRRRRRVRRLAVSALAALAAAAVLASVVALIALGRSQADEREARERFADLLGTQALNEAERDPLLAVALATESIARSTTPPLDAKRALFGGRTRLAEAAGPVPAGGPLPVGDAIALAMAPDGSRIATGERSGEVTVWDGATREPLGALRAPTGGIQDLAFAPDGALLAASDDNGSVWLWDTTEPGDPPTEPFVALGGAGRNNVVWSIDFSPDGSTLALGTEFSGVILAELSGGDERTLAGTESVSDFLSVAFSPDGSRLVAGTGEGNVATWSMPSGEPVGAPTAAHPSNDVWELVFDPTGRTLVTGSSDATARTWDAATMTPRAGAIRVPGGELEGLVVPPDGAVLYAGASDGTVWTFDLATAAPIESTAVAHSEEVIAAAGSSDGQVLVTLGDDEQVRLWRAPPLAPVGPTPGVLGGAGVGIALDPGGTELAVGRVDGTVDLLRLDSGEVRALADHTGRVFGVAFVEPGALVTGDDSGTVRRWDTESGRLEAERPGAHEGRIMGIAVAPDEATIATVGADGTVRLWAAADLSPRTEPLDTGESGGGDVVFTPDGERVVAASGRTVHVWTVDGDPVTTFDAAADVVWGLGISPDSSLIATAGADQTVAVWDLDDPTVALQRLGHSGVATDVAFAADGETLITTSRAGEVRFWDRRSGQLLGEPFAAHATEIGEVWRVATDAERSRMWIAGADAVVREIDVLNRDRACEVATAALDRRQLDRYLGGDAPVACTSSGS